MLRVLRIVGFALIDELELSFGPGLVAITGETGAGKSIILDALGLLRGGRASTDAIRTGRDDAQVEAVFDLPEGSETRRRLESEGRDLTEGLLVRRIVARSGRGRVYLGGALATAGELGATIAPLIDLTSQHDQQSLMSAESQLDILDAFADNRTLRAQMRSAYDALADARAALASFDADARTRAQREDLLRFQLRELEEADVKVGEDETLRAERERVRGAERFLAAANRGEETLYSGEDAAAGRIAGVVRELGTLAGLDPSLAPLVERLRDAQALVEDVSSELVRYAGGIRFEPGRLEEIEERLFLLNRLLRKHGGTLADLAARRAELAAELAEMGSFEEALAARREAVARATATAAGLAETLSTRRRKAAVTLARKVDETLADLSLSGAHVGIEVAARVPDAVGGDGAQASSLGPTGADRVHFTFAPNLGEEARPLARIASGGELSRVMLAVKRALASTDEAQTYVFDEVDTGVGGGVGEVIGRKLKAIAEDRQVFVVTHLAQIAAFADQHIYVEKRTAKGRTSVQARPLQPAERAAELARMLAGKPPSAEAQAHAGEMLRKAQALIAAAR